MIHRALFGSVERFFAILLEHYAGAFPTWLAPEQVRVLAVREDQQGYADSVLDRLGGRRLPGGGRVDRPSPSGPGSARPSWPRCPTSWWWATTTWRPAPSGSTAAAPSGPSAGWRSTSSVEELADDVATRRDRPRRPA